METFGLDKYLASIGPYRKCDMQYRRWLRRRIRKGKREYEVTYRSRHRILK